MNRTFILQKVRFNSTTNSKAVNNDNFIVTKLRTRAIFFLICSLSLFSCTNDTLEPESLKTELTKQFDITLHFYQNDSETKAEFEIGLQWCFSFLGAHLEEGSWRRATRWEEGRKILLDIDELGFNQNAEEQLKKLINLFKQSEEYELTGGIDAGRFVVSIFNNPNHYYKIVGMPEKLFDFLGDRKFLKRRAAIIESAVAFGERSIQLPKQGNTIVSLAYLSEELSGSLKDSTHQVKENEVMDVMDNGQLRFGIYDANFKLIGGGDTTLSAAGKPSKCLWCHEVNIQRAFAAISSIPSYYSPWQFDSIIARNKGLLNNYRSTLITEVDFNDNSQHVELEKLYIRFMEPSAKRLAAEWNISETKVNQKLVSIGTHIQEEFSEMGELYFRNQIENFSPYQVLPSAVTARETVNNEPDLLP